MRLSSVTSWCSALSVVLFQGVNAFVCEPATFTAIIPSNASVDFAYHVEANGTFGIYTNQSDFQSNGTELPPLCAVSIEVPSSANTSYHFALFLPDSWDGRFFSTGNPEFAGGIAWQRMGALLQYSDNGTYMVAMSTDGGHVGPIGDIKWAIDNPDGIIDWSWRALHGSTVMGKQIAASLYGSDVSYSYYTGCSNGGRQGWKEVQMFPEDYVSELGQDPIPRLVNHTVQSADLQFYTERSFGRRTSIVDDPPASLGCEWGCH